MFMGGYAYQISHEQQAWRRVWRVYQKFLFTFCLMMVLLTCTGKLDVDGMTVITDMLCLTQEINGSWWFLATFMIFLFVFHYLQGIIRKAGNYNFLILAAVVSVPTLIACICFIPMQDKLLPVLGKYSMSMWLFHMFIVNTRYYFDSIYITNSPIGLFFIVVVVSFVYAVIEQNLRKAFDTLCKIV